VIYDRYKREDPHKPASRTGQTSVRKFFRLQTGLSSWERAYKRIGHEPQREDNHCKLEHFTSFHPQPSSQDTSRGGYFISVLSYYFVTLLSNVAYFLQPLPRTLSQGTSCLRLGLNCVDTSMPSRGFLWGVGGNGISSSCITDSLLSPRSGPPFVRSVILFIFSLSNYTSLGNVHSR